jgi:phosphoribosylamine---glycine ligase
MRVCVVGAGGREHALAVALARTATVVVAPGNPGIEALSGELPISCTTERPEDVEADLWVIGPEAPLVDGLADRLRKAGRPTFGPGADGARLEGSKKWMKEVLVEAGVPTAAHAAFSTPEAAVGYLRRMSPPYVVKTDGLAGGKGVLVTDSIQAAIADVGDKLLGQKFGDAGRVIVIEEGLIGTELSIMAICDGTLALPLAASQDFKRANDGDTGANTGGMGAYSPVPAATPEVIEEIMQSAIRPTLATLAKRGIDYRGVLYAGVMLTDAGPKILEFNVRFGDPETQVVLPRWRGDVAEILLAAAEGRLDNVAPPSFSDETAAVCVVLAADGYPGSPRLGEPISGVGAAVARSGVTVFSAGVGASDGSLVTAGGRVLGVTALAATVAEARAHAYDAAHDILGPGLWFRADIALAASQQRSFPAQGISDNDVVGANAETPGEVV